MVDYTLYCFAQSGHCFKAALMLNLCGADWAPRHVDYFKGETHTPAYREINEMGEARFMLRFTKTGETQVTDFLRGRMIGAFSVLNGHLAHRRFAVGERPTIADLSMCGYLYFADEFGISWTDYPNIGRWLDDIRALPGWAHPYELMPGHPLPE